jgi:drug/metabolite transporter (DMT)-like permease
MDFNNIKNWQFLILISLCIVVWAFAFPLIKIGLNELSPINLTIMRFFVVSVIFLFILFFNNNRISKLQKKDIFPIFFLGFFGVMVYHLTLNYGELYVSPSAASLIIATIPIQIIILATIFLKEKIILKKLFGVIIALTGVIIISIWGKKDPTFNIEYISAIIGVIIAAMMGAFYTIAGKRLLTRYSPLSLTIYAMLFGYIGLFPLIRIELFNEVSQLTPMGWFSVLFLGIFSTVIGYIIWYIALEIKTASEISVYLYAIPVIATIITFFWFGDVFTEFYYFGGSLVIIGLIIVNYKIKNSNKKFD